MIKQFINEIDLEELLTFSNGVLSSVDADFGMPTLRKINQNTIILKFDGCFEDGEPVVVEFHFTNFGCAVIDHNNNVSIRGMKLNSTKFHSYINDKFIKLMLGIFKEEYFKVLKHKKTIELKKQIEMWEEFVANLNSPSAD